VANKTDFDRNGNLWVEPSVSLTMTIICVDAGQPKIQAKQMAGTLIP